MAVSPSVAIPRSMALALLLVASDPALAEERRITCPNLTGPAARERFQTVFTLTCDRPPGIRRGSRRIETALDAPPDPASPAPGLRWPPPTIGGRAAPDIARDAIDHG